MAAADRPPGRAAQVTGDALAFTIRIDHNPNLAVGQQTVHAIIGISAAEPDPGTRALPVAAEVIIIDKSRSMTGSRIAEACRAARAAVDVLRDGTYFAVLAGHSYPELVYPPDAVMIPASGPTRAAAKEEIDRVVAGGATSMSTWLALADTLLVNCPAQIKHAVMMTDGHSTEDDGALAVVLGQCAGHFVCDCRGVGDDWKPDELREVARTLLGTWAPVAAPEQLADDFRAVLTGAMAKRAPGVLMRVRLTGQTKISYVAQVMPSIEELTGKAVVSDGGRTVEFPLGDWGEQVRDYDLRLEVSQHDLGIENDTRVRPARVEIVVPPADGDARVTASASLGVQWTTDVTLSGSINRRVAGYTGREELAAAVDAGLRAWRDGEPDAQDKVGRAVRLAYEHHDGDLLERFTAIAEIVSKAAGIVRLRGYEQVSRRDLIWTSYLSELSQYVDPDPGGDD
jgi:hypothetical protein